MIIELNFNYINYQLVILSILKYIKSSILKVILSFCIIL